MWFFLLYIIVLEELKMVSKKDVNFSHLHVHTDASPDGLTPVDKLVKFAAELGYTELAMTDHGTLANTVSFYTECKENGIKPIIGLEAYMLWNGKRHHITLNAKNYTGFVNLINMSNEAHKNYTSGYPLMTVEMMSKYSKDVALFTGCPTSPIHVGELSDGLNFAATMVDVFGSGNVYSEMMFVMDKKITDRPLAVAKHLGLPIVITNDVHYPTSNLRQSHKILTECRNGYSYDSDSLWLKSYDEMVERGKKFFSDGEIKEWMLNAKEFALSTETWNMFSKPKLPKAEHLKSEFYDNLYKSLEIDCKKNPKDADKRRERFKIEMNVLEKMEFIDYFCILCDIVNYAKSKNILVGPGRGSAAGSYVLYLTGVTSIDPIEYNLYFERFLNEARKEYPDVDVDFPSDKRQMIIDYATSRWGAYPVATYAHYGHKNTIDDITRELHLDRKIASDASDFGVESKQFEKWCGLNELIRPTYDAMQEQIRHAGKHAGGVVITDQPIPVENISGKLVAAWTEGNKKQLTGVGVVKFDLLGLSALTQIQMMRNLVGTTQAPEIIDGSPVFNIFKNGDTLGIFQWTGSDGIRSLTMKIAPDKFDDLIVINSLYRPGALDAGTAQIYPELKIKPRLIHPGIDEVLKETNGAIVFQEQVMKIFTIILGGSLAESDLSRRIIFKAKPGDVEWEKKVEELHQRFLTECKITISKTKLSQLWNELYTHTRYSFNKAHATAYASIAYEMAWFKYYHPKVFYMSMLNYDVDNTQSYLLEMVLRNIKVKLPHINTARSEYYLDSDGDIQMPLSVVNNLSANGSAKIANELERNGPFLSIEDFRKRVTKRECNSRVCKHLWVLGAFNGLAGNKELLFSEVDEDEEKGGLSEAEIQFESLGFILPTIDIAEYIMENSTEENVVVGYIKSWKDKRNVRGKAYRVYTVMPNGMFWIDDELAMEKVKKGDFVYIEKNNYGKAIVKKKVKFN